MSACPGHEDRCTSRRRVRAGGFDARVLVPLGAAALATVACGSSQPPAATLKDTPPTATTSSPEWQAYDPHWSNAQWANCMRAHDIPLNGPDTYGDIGFVGPPFDRAAYLAAQKTCEPTWRPSKDFSIDEIISAQRYKQSFDACVLRNGGSPGAQPSQGAQSTCRAQLGPAPEIHGPHASRI
jgi:hypothetical protein